MFGRMMNNFYYGKSGKGDFRKEDLPKNRLQLFFAMLRVRFMGLCSLNVISALAFVPMGLVLGYAVLSLITSLNVKSACDEILLNAGFVLDGMMDESTLALAAQTLLDAGKIQTEVNIALNLSGALQSMLLITLALLVPCIAITGPVQVGMAYITRNWARDEHAFVWADFKDAVKQNWKQSLPVSVITGLIPLVVYTSWTYYEALAVQNSLFIVPQAIVCMAAILWCLALVYIYPLIVGYEAKLSLILKNAFMIAIARLPQTVLCRLVTVIPAVIALLVGYFTPYAMYAMLILFAYYLIIGNALSRFVFASVSNAAFDKLINVHIEGAKVNRGMSEEDDWDDEEETLEN